MDPPVGASPLLDLSATGPFHFKHHLNFDVINACGAEPSWPRPLWAAWGHHHAPSHAAGSLSTSFLWLKAP